jgi:hypothetical protein
MTTVTDSEIRKASPRLGAEIAGVVLTAGVENRPRAYRKVIAAEQAAA